MEPALNNIILDGLSVLTYNGNALVAPKDNETNIYMGIGLWSAKNGLSEGLPIDVMQMLLSVTLIKAHLKKPSKIFLLIADSMAISEGADKEAVTRLVAIYKRSLEPLLELLNVLKSCEIILASELQASDQFKEVFRFVECAPAIIEKANHNYFVTQTAITRYMQIYKGVGVKVGWIHAESKALIKGAVSAFGLAQLDELKFDRFFEEIFRTSIQYVYAKAGMKQPVINAHPIVSEACPYTAFRLDQRYVVQTLNERSIKSVSPIQSRVAEQWKGVAETCVGLMNAQLVSSSLLPKDCIKSRNAKATVYNMLNHWVNAPVSMKKRDL